MSYHRHIPLIDDQWEIGIDTGKFLNAIGDSLFDLGDLKLGSVLKKVAGTAKKVQTHPDLAFELVLTALRQACTHLSKEHFQDAIDNASGLVAQENKFKWDTRQDIEDLNASIDSSFFDYPAGWAFLQVFKYKYTHFLLDALKVDAINAQLVTDKLPETFWNELIKEWDRNTVKYAPLNHFFKSNPFAANIGVFEKRQKYYQRIGSAYHQSVLNDERIRLSDIYIEPNFKVHKRNLPKDHYEIDRDGFMGIEFDGNTIHDYICNYFIKGELAFKDIPAESSRLMLLLGQPGQGKTSFTSRVIYDILNHRGHTKDLVFVKLNRLNDPRQFVKTPFDQLKEHFAKEHFDIESGLLILDGLDELYMTEGLTKAEINDFFLILSRTLRDKTNLYVIVTSRFHYVELSNIPKGDALIVALEPLSLDQQIEWLEKYRHFFQETKLTADDLREIDEQKELNLKALWELVNQPILLQLIAKADFAIKEVSNRGEIYRQLFDTLIQRSWDSQDGQLKKFEIEPEEFREFLRALAHRIYQSNREFITLKELEEWQSQTQGFVDGNLNVKHKDLGEAMKDVLITFYFRSVEDEQERAKFEEDRKSSAIEFYHKSLQEYLAMEHIWYSIKDKMTDKNKKQKFVINDWKPALELIWNLTTPNGLTEETSAYLREIIQNDDAETEKEELRERLVLFLPDFFQRQFIFKYDTDSVPLYPIDMGLQCFYVVFTVYWYVLIERFEINKIWEAQFLQLLYFHQSHRFDFIYLSKAALAGINFYGFNLAEADMSGADLSGAYLAGADLRGTDMSRADLSGAILDGANLSGANLSEANLSGAKLTGADLSGAFLRGAVLIGAFLNRANLNGADLSEAVISRAYMNEAYLVGADLTRVINLTLEQLIKVNSLRDVISLSPELRQGLEDKGYSHLFVWSDDIFDISDHEWIREEVNELAEE